MSAARTVYEQNVKPLPLVEQLRLASLILDHLAQSRDIEVELSDAWSDEDLRDVTAFSLNRAEQVAPSEEPDA